MLYAKKLVSSDGFAPRGRNRSLRLNIVIESSAACRQGQSRIMSSASIFRTYSWIIYIIHEILAHTPWEISSGD